MTKEEAKIKYEELFNTPEIKAAAFDKIAQEYYQLNFGTKSKSDLDVLMFSLYLDRILEDDQINFNAYSDYTLSKQLGITQGKVSNLKVKKELLYPYENFDWRESLKLISNRAVYEDEKIKLLVPDKNLYLEIKNAIECNGGFIEIQLTPNLLQVRLQYFLDLLVSISDNQSREKIREDIKRKIQSDEIDTAFIESEPLGKILQEKTPEMIIEIISECVPMFGGVVKTIATNLYEAIKRGSSK